MPIFGTLATIIGPAIAKAIFSSWLNEATLANAVGSEIVDTIKAAITKRSEQRNAERELDIVGRQIADALRLLADAEAASIDESGRLAIAHALADTLHFAKLTSELLVGFNLEQDRLTQHLHAAHPQATQGLNSQEAALYRRVLSEASREMLAITPQLQDFALALSGATLRRLDGIADDVRAVHQQPQRAIDAFTERYRGAVITDLDRMETFGLPRMSRVTNKQRLSMAYITLAAERRGTESRSRSAESIAGVLSEELVAATRHEAPVHRYAQPVDQAMAECTRLVIRGEAGAGKSTLLQWLAVHAANQAFPSSLRHWNLSLPFFIRLRSCVDPGFPAPEAFVQPIARNFAATMPPGWVQQQLDDGALVLIDGVDELPRKQRDDLLTKLKKLVGDFPHARYIITSRPAGLKDSDGERWQEWEEWAEEAGFANLTLEPMTLNGSEEFITRWHQALAEARRDEDRSVDLQRTGDNLKRLLRQRPDLRRLATNPLLCAMICALHRERGETLPAERTKLYDECIEMLLTRRDEARKIELDETYPAGLSHAQKQEAIQSFAYWLMDNGYSSVEIERADDHFERVLPSLRLPEIVSGKQLRAFFVERAGLLREPAIGRVDFMHRTFQEFLAAQEMLAVDKIDALLKHAHQDQWREVVILAAGLARPKEREELLKGLIKRGDERKTRRHALHLLAVACLETAVRVSPAVSEAVIERAKALLPPQDDDEAALVAKAGNAIVPLLAPEPKYSEEEAARCITTLAQIGGSAAMSQIAKYAGDQRGRVVEALGAAWNAFDRAEYARSVLSRSTSVRVGKLASWAGFEYLAHVSALAIRNLNSQTLNPLARLTNLTKLALGGSIFASASVEAPVYDLKPLAELHNLSTLRLSNMQIASLRPLLQLASLSNKAVDALPRSQLRALVLVGIQVADFEPIADLMSLEALDFVQTPINDLSLLARLSNLRSLMLFDTMVDDYSPLEQLEQLDVLEIGGNKTYQLDSLTKLRYLSRLGLDDYRLTDLSPVSHLDNLSSFSISYTPVNDISPLAALPKLTKLYISETNVRDLSPLRHMTHVQLAARSTPALVAQWRSFGGQVVDNI